MAPQWNELHHTKRELFLHPNPSRGHLISHEAIQTLNGSRTAPSSGQHWHGCKQNINVFTNILSVFLNCMFLIRIDLLFPAEMSSNFGLLVEDLILTTPKGTVSTDALPNLLLLHCS